TGQTLGSRPRGAAGGAGRPKIRPYFLASGWNPAIHRAISHGNMAQKAVRWQPGHKARLLTRFRRNQPENHHYVATRFFYASAARSLRALRPPIEPLETEDVRVH